MSGLLPMEPQTFMYVVGVIEMAVGVMVRRLYLFEAPRCDRVVEAVLAVCAASCGRS